MSYFNFPHTRNYDSDLGWLIRNYKKLDDQVKFLLECCDQVKDNLDVLNDFKRQLESGNFPEAMLNAFYEWCRIHVPDILAETVKAVFFGLTDDGYFVAYIPDSWNDIKFNTTEFDIDIPECQDYGHLVLTY